MPSRQRIIPLLLWAHHPLRKRATTLPPHLVTDSSEPIRGIYLQNSFQLRLSADQTQLSDVRINRCVVIETTHRYLLIGPTDRV